MIESNNNKKQNNLLVWVPRLVIALPGPLLLVSRLINAVSRTMMPLNPGYNYLIENKIGFEQWTSDRTYVYIIYLTLIVFSAFFVVLSRVSKRYGGKAIDLVNNVLIIGCVLGLLLSTFSYVIGVLLASFFL